MSDPIRPYYDCFVQWLSMTRPDVAFMLRRGMVDVNEITPYIREWAGDITSK